MRKLFEAVCGILLSLVLATTVGTLPAICSFLLFGTYIAATSQLFSGPLTRSLAYFGARTHMGEVFVMAVIGGILGVSIFGIGYWAEHKSKEAEKEEQARRIAEENRILSPKVRIKLFADLPETQPYKPPLKRYHLYIDNANLNSVPITNLRMEFNFKHVIDHVRKQVVLPDLHGGATLGPSETWAVKRDGSQDILKDEPRNYSLNQRFTFEIDTENINKTIKNTNIVYLDIEKWNEQGSSLVAEIVLDTSKQPHIQKQLGERGTYTGKYSYEIGGRQLTERMHENIPDEPLGWESITIPLHSKKP